MFPPFLGFFDATVIAHKATTGRRLPGFRPEAARSCRLGGP